MDAERWRRIENIFLLAVEKDAEEQAALLDEQCGDHGDLRLEVERLLAADRGAARRLSAAVAGTFRLLHQPLEPGTRLGPYEILDLIGEGGMGCVYRARRCDEVFDKQVAIKVVRHGLVGEVMLRRFARERRIMARLDHPFIARVFDGGSTADGSPYLVMEYVDGHDLLEFADEHQLDLHARLGLFCQVCEAVEWAHQRQIVHRDLKPSNILVDRSGRPRLLDFGIARIVGTPEDALTAAAGDTRLLTPRYASPEQVSAREVTGASDQYSLGVILYELLTGCAVHGIADRSRAESVQAASGDRMGPPSEAARVALGAGRHVPVAPEELQGDLDRIVLTALETDPLRRFASVAALSDQLQRLTTSRSTATRRPGVLARIARTIRRRPVAAIVTVAASVLGLVLIRSALIDDRHPPGTQAPAGKIMLAVLPLENLTGADDQQPFADGLHEEIVSRLGRLQPERLGVIARTSVLQYQGTRKSILDIGGELGVQYVLEGSVRQWGPRVRVTAQFIEVASQTHLWAETFDWAIGDLFAIQGEIAGQVADSLQLAILPAAQAIMDHPADLPSDAYAEYLRGKYYWHRRWLEYPANAQRALDHFQSVIAAAPDYAEGYAALGQTYHYLSTSPASRAEHQRLLSQARAALSRALAIDPRLASALATEAWIAFRNDWDWTRAEHGFDEALRHDPNNPDIHQQLATLLAYTGRPIEADREIRVAQQLDPLSPTLHVSAFYVHLVGRRWDMAEQTATKVAELVPGGSIHVYFASLVQALRGRCEAALQTLSTLERPASAPEEGTLREEHNGAFVLGRCGRAAEARRLIRALEQRPEYLAQRIAVIYAGLGDSTRALQWLEESLRRREDVLTSVALDPRFDSLAGEPRFQRVIEKLGIPARR